MTNSQYINKTLAYVDRILVDTSTLMMPGFQRFVCNNKEQLISEGKKIIIPRAVYAELTRLMDSTGEEKRKAAIAAIKVIEENKNIFHVEFSPLTTSEIMHAFADVQLLSELTLHRSDYSQLLITNDRKLSCDAFGLNQQQSCNGRKVLVCYINVFGELQCCACARQAPEKSNAESEQKTFSNNTVFSDRISSVKESSNEDSWEFDWISGLISLSSIGLAFGLYKGGKTLCKLI